MNPSTMQHSVALRRGHRYTNPNLGCVAPGSVISTERLDIKIMFGFVRTLPLIMMYLRCCPAASSSKHDDPAAMDVVAATLDMELQGMGTRRRPGWQGAPAGPRHVAAQGSTN